MRCLLLRHNGNSNAKGMAEGKIFKRGSASPSLKPSADWVQGNALAAVNCCTPFRSCDN